MLAFDILRLFRLNIVVAALNIVVSIALARALTPEPRGQYAIVVLWVGIVAYIGVFGTHLSLGRRAAQHPELARQVYRDALRIITVISMPTIALFLCIAWLVSDTTLSGIPPEGWLLAALSLPFSVWNAIQLQVEIARKKSTIYSIAIASSAIIQLAVVASLWVLGDRNLVHYLSALVLGSAGAAIIAQILIAQDLANLPEPQPKPVVQSTRSLLINSRFDALSITLIMLVSAGDRMFVSATFPPEVLGWFVVALSISHLQGIVGDAISPLFFARTAVQGGHEDRLIVAGRLRQTLIINICVALGLAVVAPFLMYFMYGAAYSQSITMALIMLLGVCLRSAMKPMEEILKARNKSLQQSMMHLVALSGFVVVSFMAIQQNAPTGIAVAFSVGATAAFICAGFVVSRELDVSVHRVLVPTWHDFLGLLREVGRLLTRLRRRG